ncbi:MAG TPA: fibronectin type III domain-containing protein [Tepidisphaeraceae bacterium]|jgi:hypothetical protein
MLSGKRSTNVKGSSRRLTVQWAALESRIMMHADPNDPTHHDEIPSDLGVFPVINAGTTTDSTSTGGDASASSPLSAVPALSSRPGAYARIYLDFTGDSTPTWGQYTPGTTPAYDQDGDPTTFSDGELASIREIWSRVVEKYSPFNVDVTTVNPGNLNNKQSLKVVFGGDGAWLGAQAGGVSYVGSFANSAPNVVFVFPKMLANGYAQYSAEAAAHEAGHAFGLQHQSTWSGSTKTAEYAPANAAGDAPIMGSSYTARRGMWWYGTASDSPTHIQDDLAVISSTTNGFGYRADDFGNDLPSASALTLNNTSASAAGVIEKTSDQDVFSFTSGAGAVNFSADRVTGGMLDLKLSLRDSAGNVLASADTSSLGESLSASLAAQGTYYVTVASHGGYGDVGQYTLAGSLEPVVTVTPLAAPTGLVAGAASATAVDLAWTDNANNETGYAIQRSADGGANWTDLASVGADLSTYRDTTAAANTTYAYRVSAFDATRTSDWSNLANVTTPTQATVPAAPTNLVARTLSTTSIRLTWTDNADNETGFKVYGSRDGGGTWTLLGTVGANVTAVDHTGLRRNQLWTYKVRAYNAVGDSADSNASSAKAALTPAVALAGDANLDGSVDFNDMTLLARNYNAVVGGSAWQQGDFNGDGVVDFNDLTLMAQNYNTAQANTDPISDSEWGTITPVTSDGASTATTTASSSKAQSVTSATQAKARQLASVFSLKPIARPKVVMRVLHRKI